MSFEQALRAGHQVAAPLGAPARTAGITGVGAALPERSVLNEELAAPLGVDPAWIEQRTGIRARRYAGTGEGVSELGVRAGEAALREAGIAAGELDLLLVATIAADDITPAAAPIIAHELGARRAAAIDVGAACSGAIAALALASGWIEAGHAEHALVIGAEVLSRFIDTSDRSTAPLFGDGAGAIALSGEAAGRIGPFVLGSDGSAREAIRVTRERGVLEMDGHDTFLRAVYHLTTATREVLMRDGLGVEDIDLFVYHQANGRILAAVAERLGVPRERVFDCIGELGNTSAASVPLALDSAVRSGALQPGSTRTARRGGGGTHVGCRARPLGGAVSPAAQRDGCALVTGASRGIGAAAARSLASDGWAVGVNFRRDEDGALATVEQIEREGGRALALRADVKSPDELEQTFATLEQTYGRVLVLVNNAGVRADELALTLGDADWQEVIDTNLTAAFRATRRALREMIRARFGRIVNVASVVGPRANAGQSNYAAAKAGLIGMTRTIAVEVARRGVTVNAIAPGLIDTEMTRGLSNGLAERVPARRSGTPEDVAACVRFLASEQAGYVTGSTLFVDGGLGA